MKRTLVVILMTVCMISGAAFADDHDDNGWAGWDKGFRFASEDGKNTLKIGARVQFRLTNEDPDTGLDQTSFRLRRAKLKLSGQALGQVAYTIQANFAGGSAELEDAFLVYTKKKMAQLWAGQGKVFFARQNLTSSGKLQFVDRSIITSVVEGRRDQGLALMGQTEEKKFAYQVGVYNGNGVNNSSNDDDNFQYTGRVVYTPFGEYKNAESSLDRPEKSRLAVGAKVLLEEVDDLAGTVTDKTITGVEVAYKIGGFNAVGEYFMREDDVTTIATMTQTDTDAFYIQAGYLFESKPIEIALRLAEISPDVVGPSQDLTETGIAVSWYMKKHDYKLQFDVREIEDDGDPTQDTTEARAQLQLAF